MLVLIKADNDAVHCRSCNPTDRTAIEIAETAGDLLSGHREAIDKRPVSSRVSIAASIAAKAASCSDPAVARRQSVQTSCICPKTHAQSPGAGTGSA